MKLSVLEQSTLSEGATGEEAIANTVALAKEIDLLNYHRIWLSEHHNMSILQGSAPEVLLASIGAQTKRIRIGSGGVMLPNHSAYHIAEAFRLLEALYPGRVDCGIGRASGGDSYSTSLLNPAPQAGGDFPAQVDQLESFFHDECTRAIAMPRISSAPEMWLLSAANHANSGMLAAEKGMGLAVALFINPQATPDAVREYRKNFKPSREFPEPRVLIAMGVVCAATEEKVQELKKVTDFFRLLRDSGRYPSMVPSAKTMQNFTLTEEQDNYLRGVANREVTGLPSEVKRKILERAEQYEADEAMLTCMAHQLADKMEAYRLLAHEFSEEKTSGAAV
jgi:luciferase family oxidoreductase group 1